MAYTKADQKNDARNKQTRTEKAPRFNNAQFIQYELDKAQQAELKAKVMTSDDLFSSMEEEIDNGYKFTIKWDEYSSTYSCFMQGSGDGGRNAGFILTGRGTNAAKAVKQCLWKHNVCLDRDWSGYAERRSGIDLDD